LNAFHFSRRARALALVVALTGAHGASRAQPAAAVPAQPRFDILEYVVEGDTLLGSAAIERAVYEFLGPGRGVADAEAARKALEKAYQDAGFLSVSVLLPPQRVDGGSAEIRLQVVQAPVEKLRVTGAQYHLPSALREALPSLTPGTVPNFNEMQQELAQLSRASADREITPILAAGDAPGTMNVELKVQDSLPLHGSVELNDKQSQNTVAGRLEAGLAYDNLFQRGHGLGWNLFYSPRRPSEANIHSLSYQLPLGGAGDRLYLLYTHSDSNTPTPLGGATVSRGNTTRLRWRDELGGLEGLSHALTWGLSFHDLRDRNLDVGGVSTASPPLRYPSLNTSYELDLSGSLPGRSSHLQADLTLSLPGLSRRDVDCYGTPRDQFECKRSSASARFQVLGLNLVHREPLGRWSISARLQAQITDTPLVPAEQVVYGGQDSVRGYYEGEQAGDLGAALRLELGTPAWAVPEGASLHALGFYDRAVLRRLYALPGEVVTPRLGSAGLGLRVDTAFGLQITLDGAWVLIDTSRLDGSAQQPVSGRSVGRGQRWDFSLRQAF
jgi:hemolysin activation/secretion protein